MCKDPAMSPRVATGPHRVVVFLLEPLVGYDATIPPAVLGGAHGPDGEPL